MRPKVLFKFHTCSNDDSLWKPLVTLLILVIYNIAYFYSDRDCLLHEGRASQVEVTPGPSGLIRKGFPWIALWAGELCHLP